MISVRPTLARNTVVVAMPEAIDLNNAAGIAGKLTVAVSRNALVIIDMSATTFCDCAGARTVVRAYKRATDSGTELRLAETAAPVRRIFSLMGIDRLVDIYPSVEAAHSLDGTDPLAESASPDPVTRPAAKARVHKAALPARLLLKVNIQVLAVLAGSGNCQFSLNPDRGGVLAGPGMEHAETLDATAATSAGASPPTSMTQWQLRYAGHLRWPHP